VCRLLFEFCKTAFMATNPVLANQESCEDEVRQEVEDLGEESDEYDSDMIEVWSKNGNQSFWLRCLLFERVKNMMM
jgi:hypothetical protein